MPWGLTGLSCPCLPDLQRGGGCGNLAASTGCVLGRGMDMGSRVLLAARVPQSVTFRGTAGVAVHVAHSPASRTGQDLWFPVCFGGVGVIALPWAVQDSGGLENRIGCP